MATYEPPYRDIVFVLRELLGASRVVAGLGPFRELDADTLEAVVREAGRFSAEVLQPLNASGDAQGCRYRNGSVTTPAGFAEAYRRFVAGGWPALACETRFGGQGLPGFLNVVLFEMLSAANQAWAMYPGLLHGAYRCLAAHGSAELKQRFLGKLVSGEWLSTMCLTEPQAGSDLGLLRTRAEPDGDAYRIRGTKIFISGGEQDITPNILHLVLARLPHAPEGTAGISLFLVPKMIEDPQGALIANALRCEGIEHKMGIHGNATCTMTFDGARGWLVGEPNRGLACMFVMMNTARLHVGACGLGLAEVAHQNALRYARERRQMKAVPRPPGPSREAADPILYHAAVRRLLLGQKARNEGGRALAYWTALLIDQSEHHDEPAVRAECDELASLLTPVLKAFLTENAFLASSDAMQVFGGHGYIRDTGVEQLLRDSRITMIYEGTNEIQAVDLVKRKVLGDGGRRVERFLARVEEETACWPGSDAMGGRLAAMANELRSATGQIASRVKHDAEAPYRIAGEYLRLVAYCGLAYFWCMAARVAAPRASDPFYAGKIATAHYFFTYLAPEAARCAEIIREDDRPLATQIT